MRLSQLANLMGGSLVGPDAEFRNLVTDNREVSSGDVFVAIRGAKVDGAEFAAAAIYAGAVACVVEREVGVPHIRVAAVIDALAKMAGTLRQRFSGPVVGITGSAGKTTTKELIAAALSPLGSVLKTEANRNTEYTAPLLWLKVAPSDTAVVVEMGMRGPGQIAHLASFAKPTVGVITNIGVAHIELLGSRDAIAMAKAELLDSVPPEGVAILPAEDDYLETLLTYAPKSVATFGWSESADARVVGIEARSWTDSTVTVCLGSETVEIRLPVVGKHFAVNAAAALLVASKLGVSPNAAGKAMRDVQLPPMRMQLIERRGVCIVLDAYNASPPAVVASLEALESVPCEGTRNVVLGEMRELGEHAEAGHREVGRALSGTAVERVCLYGPATRWMADEWLKSGRKESSLSQAETIRDVRSFLDSLYPGDTVLIKGSRGLELERALTEEAMR